MIILVISICVIEYSLEATSYNSEKIDHTLLAEMDKTNGDSFSFFCITSRDVDGEMIDFITTTTGVKVSSAVNNILKAEGTKTQLLKLSGLTFVQLITNDNT